MAENNKIEFAPKPTDGQPWDVAIIGSGPAALTAAIYTTRGAASTLVIGGESWGGQLMLTTTVDNFPGFPEGIQGPELMNLIRKQAERFGAEFVQKNVDAIDFDPPNGGPFEVLAGGVKYLARAIIIATGADTKWLGVEGEERLRGRGVSSCAPCDAPFFKNKKVAVVGGGDSAMEEALVLTKYATSVTVIHRRNEFKASAAMQAKVMHMHDTGKIRILWSSEVIKMNGENKLEEIIIKTNLDSEHGRELKEGGIKKFEGELIEDPTAYDFQEASNENFFYWRMPLEGLFVAIGHVPATEKFKGKIETDEKGYIVVKDKAKTSLEDGVFVAGDVHDNNYRQAITAAGFGCMAGMEALRYLDKDVPTW